MSNRRKILAVALTAALMASATSISVNAYYINDVSEIKEHSVGIVGSFNNWGNDGEDDVPMTDDDGDGIYEGTVTIDEATENMVGVATMDDGTGSQVERGMTGILFKVRLDGIWDTSWGEYEPAYVRTCNSQTNCCVECEVGDKVVINVKLDTTRNAQQAIDDGEVGAYEPVYFDLIPVTYTATVESKTDYEPEPGPYSGGICGENVYYTLDSEGTLTISGKGEMDNYDYGESPFFNNPEIKNIIIENGVRSIGYLAFQGCSSLKSITISDTVTNIGRYAFDSCTSLKSVTIPDSVTSIGEAALGYYFDDSIGDFSKQSDFTITGFGGTAAERYANDNGFEFISLGEVPVPVVKTGDVTGDGSVDIADSLFVARADAGLATLTEEQKKAADVNKDGSADIADALFIARVDAGLASL